MSKLNGSCYMFEKTNHLYRRRLDTMSEEATSKTSKEEDALARAVAAHANDEDADVLAYPGKVFKVAKFQW